MLLPRRNFSGPGGCTGWSFRVSEDGKWGLLFSLLASISHLFSLPSSSQQRFFPTSSSPLTRIHTHVYSHSNQLRRLFFGPRHASSRPLLRPIKPLGGPAVATIIILVLCSRTELLSPRPAIYIYMHPQRVWWSTRCQRLPVVLMDRR